MLEIKIPLFVVHAMHMRIVKIKSQFDLSTICTYKETKNGWNKILFFQSRVQYFSSFVSELSVFVISISYAFKSSLWNLGGNLHVNMQHVYKIL